MSTYEILGLPIQVGILLLAIGLALAVVPYLGGADFGILKVPDLGPEKAKVLKRVGFLAPLIAAMLFLPLWSKKAEPISPNQKQASAALPLENRMPFDSGWIIVGYFVPEQAQFNEGPYASVVFRPLSAERGDILPKIGDVLMLKDNRNVRIVNYKSEGLTQLNQSPALAHGDLQPEDLTGVVLPKGALVFVRDVIPSSYPGKALAIWCRVADCHDNLAQCRQALYESR